MNHESLGFFGLIEDHFDFESRQIEMQRSEVRSEQRSEFKVADKFLTRSYF